MSVDIDWESLTTGPDGLALAESIRAFIHDRFQQISLPRFIQSVQVHSFNFGEECPHVELKDICDPLPDFYEYDEEEGSGSDDEAEDDDASNFEKPRRKESPPSAHEAHDGGGSSRRSQYDPHQNHPSPFPSPAFPSPSPLQHHHYQLPSTDHGRLSTMWQTFTLADQIASPMLSRSSTPGIPGGTSNMSYFHLPLSGGGLSGTPSGLAGSHHYQAPPHPWQTTAAAHAPNWALPSRQHSPYSMPRGHFHHADPPTHPSSSTTNPYGSPAHHPQHRSPQRNEEASSPSSPTPSASASQKPYDPSPEDVQIVLHISYAGSVRISLTAQILLDLPMPSFVGIPMQLNVVGLAFDGVALLAHLRRRAHFCFLAPENAVAMLGEAYAEEESSLDDGDRRGLPRGEEGSAGGLFKEIRIESEIGRKEGGRQVLKNVGKVERFVLEQVRKIFEDEVVYPSYWTFLV